MRHANASLHFWDNFFFWFSFFKKWTGRRCTRYSTKKNITFNRQNKAIFVLTQNHNEFWNGYMYLFWVWKFQTFLRFGNQIPIQFPSTSSVPVRLKKHLKSWIYLGNSGLCDAARSLRQKLHWFIENLQPCAN